MQTQNNAFKENILLIGFPSNGLVGTFTISYLVHKLDMKQIGEIDHPDLPPTLFVEDGEILPPIRIYKKNNIFVIMSDLPFDPFVAYNFAESILDYCKKNKINKIMIVSGMESVNRDPKSPKIYGLVTHKKLEKILYDNRISKFLSGSIFGTDASMISVFRKSKIPALILYAECHPFFPDPEASIVAITTTAKILGVKVDTTDIQKKIEWLRIQHRNLMDETIRSLQLQQQEKKPGRAPQIYR
ncbi:MAG: PAC2 family protein [Nitrosopumilaceae archaeon]|nr:PAC2 family protein [Nitrosopumilaceae archaeon]